MTLKNQSFKQFPPVNLGQTMKLPDAHKSNKVTGDRHLLPSVDGSKDKHSLVAASNLQKKTGVSLSLTNLALTFDLEAEDEYAVSFKGLTCIYI